MDAGEDRAVLHAWQRALMLRHPRGGKGVHLAPVELGQTVDLAPAAPVEPDHAGEAFLLGRGVDQLLEGPHGTEPTIPRMTAVGLL